MVSNNQLKPQAAQVLQCVKYYNDTKTVAAKEATAGGKATLSLGHVGMLTRCVCVCVCVCV
jgi:hypothetical protein